MSCPIDTFDVRAALGPVGVAVVPRRVFTALIFKVFLIRFGWHFGLQIPPKIDEKSIKTWVEFSNDFIIVFGRVFGMILDVFFL